MQPYSTLTIVFFTNPPTTNPPTTNPPTRTTNFSTPPTSSDCRTLYCHPVRNKNGGWTAYDMLQHCGNEGYQFRTQPNSELIYRGNGYNNLLVKFNYYSNPTPDSSTPNTPTTNHATPHPSTTDPSTPNPPTPTTNPPTPNSLTKIPSITHPPTQNPPTRTHVAKPTPIDECTEKNGLNSYSTLMTMGLPKLKHVIGSSKAKKGPNFSKMN